ncbi:MAG: lipid II flippase MurJ [Patescibacteria group bacterium]
MRLSFLNQEVVNVHAAALVLGAAGLASRLVGVVRNRLLFAEFGAGRELDIYYAAFQIPDFMAAVFLLGAASAAILPLFQEYLLKEKKKAQEFIGALSSLFFLGALAASLTAFFVAPAVIPLAAPGFSADEQALTVALTRIMLLSPVLFGLSGIFSVVVQSYQLFFVYALAPILYNLGIVLGIVWLVPLFGVHGLGMGVILGAAAHSALQFGAAASRGFHFGAVRAPGPGVRRVLLLSFPRVLAMSLTQLTMMALVAIGSLLEHGSVAVFSAAQDLYFVPIGVFGVSYAVAVFPRMARSAAQGAGADFFAELAAGIRGILFWVAPAATLTIVLRAHIVRAALGAGAFSWEDTRLTAAVLASLAVAMAAGAVQTLLIRAFYALGKTWLPLGVSVATSLFSIGLAWVLTSLLAPSGRAAGSAFGREVAALFRLGDLPHPEVLGLGIGFAAGIIANVIVLWIFLLRSGAAQFGVRSERQQAALGKIVIAAVLAGIAAYVVRVSFSETVPLITFTRVVGQGAAAAGAGMGVYWAALAWLGSEDAAAMRRAAARRLFSIGVLPREWDGELK